MGRTLHRNMTLLEETIAGIVRGMNPRMICFCQVSGAARPLCETLAQQLETEIMRAWTDAATEPILLRSLFATGFFLDGTLYG